MSFLENFTPLMALCISSAKEENLIESAGYLIKFGADVNAVDSYGNSALIYAAKSGKTSLTQHLIDCNADINRSNSEGWNVRLSSFLCQLYFNYFVPKGTPFSG